MRQYKTQIMNSLIYNKTILLLLTIFLSGIVIAQKEGPSKDKDWRIEVEPSSFVLNGIAGSITYNVSRDNKFNLGLFAAALDIPNRFRDDMFNHVGMDTSSARLGFELAVMGRYKLDIFKKLESNPYVGLIVGWEYFDIKQPSFAEKVRLKTFLVTPYVGYEFYFFRQWAYLNPQLRSVFYLGPTSSIPSRNESLKSTFIFPQISVGVRL